MFQYYQASQASCVSTRNLPHWNQPHGLYFVTFRLADSIPKGSVAKLAREREGFERKYRGVDPTQLESAERRTLLKMSHKKLSRWLDQGHGSCALRIRSVARIVANAITYFNGERYVLGRWVVASNHVHVLMIPIEPHNLSDIVHSWKSYSANKCNRVLCRKGTFWMDERFDCIVRSKAQLQYLEEYIGSHQGIHGGVRLSDIAAR